MAEVGGRKLGAYRLLSQIAVGGMAEVYEAVQSGVSGFEKKLALKVIHPNYSEDQAFVQMLIDEAKLAVQLQHANIVQTYDLGKVDDQYYIAMELVDGVDVYRLLKRASENEIDFPFEVVAYIGQEVSAGLDYAHKKTDSRGRALSIVHRDVSPQNVLCSFTGEIKIVDFGIAKASMRSQNTAAGVIKGKYYYMSPEQALGERLDARTDVFSTGILLYEMLVGQMLYLEDDMDRLLEKVRRAIIPSPSDKRNGIPRELEDIVMRALARRADDRFQSSAEMGTALSAFLRRHAPDMGPPKLGAFLHRVMGADPTAKRGKKAARPSLAQEFARDGNSLIFKLEDLRKPAQPRGRDQATSPVSLPKVARDALDFDDNEATIVDAGDIRAGLGFGKSEDSDSGRRPSPPSRHLVDDDAHESTKVEAGRRRPPPKPTYTSKPDEFFDSETFEDDDSAASTTERLRSTIELRRKVKPPESRTEPKRDHDGEDQSDVTIDAPPSLAVSPDSGPSGRTPPPPSAAATLSLPATMNPFVFQQIGNNSDEQSVTPVMASAAPTVPSPARERSQPFAIPSPERERSQPFAIPPTPAPKSRALLIGLIVAAVIAIAGTGALILGRHHHGRAGRSIEVVSVPAGAEVRIDGKVLSGATPLEILDVDPAQTHRIRVALAGFEPWSQDVRFEAEPQLRLQAVLSSLNSTLEVDTVPTGADVIVNGHLRGTTPVTIADLPPTANAMVEVRLRGYRTVDRAVTFNGKHKMQITIPLVKTH